MASLRTVGWPKREEARFSRQRVEALRGKGLHRQAIGGQVSQRLTPAQLRYLEIIEQRGQLHKGWGGYSSTRTVRLLEERGYIQLVRRSGNDWVAGMLEKGREALRRAHEQSVD